MLKIELKKEIIQKLFMLLAFFIFALVMYQGHIQKGGVYSILLLLCALLMAFQVASIFFVLFVKRELILKIENNELIWQIYDNNKLSKQTSINLEKIANLKTEINYLTGNIYSSLNITITLKDSKEIILSDGLLYDFGLEKSEEISRFLLNHNLGDETDIYFAKLVKELNIDLKKEQKFNKKQEDFTITGIISKNKKEFLALRLQIDSLYSDYKDIKTNTNNEYLVYSTNKNSYIQIKSNAIGYMVKFYKVNKKVDLKMLKEFKGATLKNKLANITK